MQYDINTHRESEPARLRMRLAVRLAALAAALLLASCAGGAPGATATPTRGPGAPTGGALRGIDFTQAQYAADLMQRAGGGEVPADRVRYVDFTGDGLEEAFVVVESGGTLGDIGAGVFEAAGSGARLIYFRKLTGHVELRDRAIIVVQGAPGPNDPACCPSQLRESVIEWRKGDFEVTSEQVVANPAAGPRP